MQQKAELEANRGEIAEARSLLNQVLHLTPDIVAQGEVHYHLGSIAYKSGDLAQAERMLRVARDQLTVSHPLDAEAGWLLGRIREEAKQPREAISFYQSVLDSGSRVACGAVVAPRTRHLPDRAGGRCGRVVPSAGYHKSNSCEARCGRVPLRSVDGIASVLSALVTRSDYQVRWSFCRMSSSSSRSHHRNSSPGSQALYERLATQMDEVKDLPATEADGIRLAAQQIAELRTHAGDAYIAFSRALTLADDRGHAEAMWRGVDLYDAAGNTQRAYRPGVVCRRTPR